MALNTCYAQDSIHLSSVSLGIAHTAGGQYFTLSGAVRYNRFELFGGLNNQLIYKNSDPVSKQMLENQNYPRKVIIGYQRGVNFFLNESKVNHILVLRYQYNSYFVGETGANGSNFVWLKRVYKQLSFLYKPSLLANKRLNIEPWLGLSVMTERSFTCCLYKSPIIGLDITLRPYYFKK